MKIKLLLIVGAIMIFANCSQKENEPAPKEKKLILTDKLQEIVSIDTVHCMPVTGELILNGKITFNEEQVARIYPLFGGTITEILAGTGDYVKKGDVIAKVRSGEVAEYEKEYKEVVQQVAITKRNLLSVEDMFAGGMASEKEVLEAKQLVSDAEANKTRLSEVFSIHYIAGNSIYLIKSPISGYVIEKKVSCGMQIRSDLAEEVFIISGLDEVWIMADIYESDISKVRPLQQVHINTLAYPDLTFEGKIDKVYNMFDEDSKTLKARIKIRNKDYQLKPGMFTVVSVLNENSDDLKPRVDSHSLIFNNGKHYVIVLKKENELEIREVKILSKENNFTFLASGLKQGERIIKRNALLVYNELITD